MGYFAAKYTFKLKVTNSIGVWRIFIVWFCVTFLIFFVFKAKSSANKVTFKEDYFSLLYNVHPLLHVFNINIPNDLDCWK